GNLDSVQSAECLLRQTALLPIRNQGKHLFSLFIYTHATKINRLNLPSNMQLVGRIRKPRYCTTDISTRRFCSLPPSVSLAATGLEAPNPLALRFSDDTPALTI